MQGGGLTPAAIQARAGATGDMPRVPVPDDKPESALNSKPGSVDGGRDGKDLDDGSRPKLTAVRSSRGSARGSKEDA